MRRDKLKKVEISYFLAPFLIIVLGFSVITYAAIKIRVNQKYTELENITLEISDSFAQSLAQTRKSSQVITELLDEKILNASQAIMLIENKYDNQVLQSISKMFNVDEVHLFDPEGEIIYSTSEQIIGWKVYESHPIYAFMMGDQSMLVEDIRRDTEDGLLYKFGYVKNADGSFLQLGILAEHIHEVLADFEITNLVHNISDRSDVKDVFYIDESYEVVASSIPSYIGWEIKDSQIGSEIAGKPAELQKIESTEDTYYSIAAPIVSDSEKIGTLLLRWPTGKMEAEVAQIVRFGASIFFIVIFTTGIILFYAYKKNKSNVKIAYYDELTGLRNSKFLMDYLDTALRHPNKRNKAVLLLNFVSFKTLNMTYGYMYGNEILKQIAFKIQEAVQSDEKLFRFDGDRFVVVFDDYEDQDELNKWADKLIRVFEEPIMIGSEKQYLDIQVALVEVNNNHTSADKMLRDATLTLSHIKDRTPIQKAFFNNAMEDNLQRQDKIVKVLREIVEGKDCPSFYLEFQPKLDLRSNEIIGFEALARLRMEELGQIGPNEFIALAEEKLLIFDLGHQILKLACTFIGQLQDAGYSDLTVAVNISGIQLLREDFLDRLQQCLCISDGHIASLEFEITESVLFDHYEQVNETLAEIKKMGITISLDDFGTGFSSFSRLEELNIDNVKIDKLFIDKITEMDEKNLIISDIISMSHKIGLEVIAEGVEDEQQKVYLRKHDCDIIQGYHLSKPLANDKALAFLSNFNQSS